MNTLDWREQKPTNKQKDLLIKLNVVPKNIPSNKGDCRDLISKLLQEQKNKSYCSDQEYWIILDEYDAHNENSYNDHWEIF